MPWREQPTPYFVLVSEIMLQQTQVQRVLPKFNEFIAHFPTIQLLAAAPLGDVLRVWSGLGYNRRAKFLHQASVKVVQDLGGILPSTIPELVALPGVGKNTAGAILAYAYNEPVVFIETNIRTVFFHHFFADSDKIDDKELTTLIEQTLDLEHPREWYWALMDYGTYLKQTENNISRSRHYTRQSKFEGSRRQVRGAVLRALTQHDSMPESQLRQVITDKRLPEVVEELLNEGMIQRKNKRLYLTDHQA